MKKKELFQQLNSLKGTIKPDQAWQQENRDLLLSQIKAQTQQLDMKFSPFKVFNFSKFALTVAKPVGSLLIIFAIILGSWTASVGATKKSLPGDLLYPVKITTERVQVNLTLNDEKRTNLEMAFAERRLDEIKVIVAQEADLDEKEDLDVPLKHFQESLVNVKSNLAKIEKSDKEKALVLANLIDEKTKEYVSVIVDNKDSFSDTTEAINTSKNIGDKALDLIIDDLEEDEDNNDSSEEIKQKVESRIIVLANDLALAESNINKIIENKALEEAKNTAETEEESEDAVAESADAEESETEEEDTEGEEGEEEKEEEEIVEEINPIDQAKNDLANANELLVKAQELLAENKFSEAFEAVKQANQILAQINQIISDYSQYLEEEEDPVIEVEPVKESEGDIIGIFNSEE